jgi:hypothetical protein
LDGTAKEFGADGQWTATRDRHGNATLGSYVNGVLEAVAMPDGRSLAFSYHADGLLASITEVGVDGVTSPQAARSRPASSSPGATGSLPARCVPISHRHADTGGQAASGTHDLELSSV